MFIKYLILLMIPLIFSLFTFGQINPRWGLIPIGLLVGLVLWEGLRWQLISVYVLCIVATIVICTNPALLSRTVINLSATITLTVLALLFTYTFPDFQIPKLTGDYAVGVTDRQVSDADGSDIGLKVWYPAMAVEQAASQPYIADLDRGILGVSPVLFSHLRGRDTQTFQNPALSDGSAKYPIIVYSQGADSFAEDNTFLFSDLASHGFVVVSVDHPKPINAYDVDMAELAEAPQATLEALARAVFPDRVRDVEITVVHLAHLNAQDELFKGRLDTDALGAVGYSLGGGVMTEYCALHQHCRVLVNLDGNPFAEARHTGVQVPYLHLSQHTFLNLDETDPTNSASAQVAQLYIDEVSDVVQHTQNNGASAYWFQVLGSGHASFTDMALWIQPRFGPLQSMLGSGDPQALYEVIHNLTRSFLSDTLFNTNSFEATQTQYQAMLQALVSVMGTLLFTIMSI